MEKKKGFNLLELMVVIIIVGILASLALVNYGPLRDNTLDREAVANLRLIQAAEKIYHMETSQYYPSEVIANINDNLKLSLPCGDSRNWNYKTTADNSDPDPANRTYCIQATRRDDATRTWALATGGDEPVKDGTCP